MYLFKIHKVKLLAFVAVINAFLWSCEEIFEKDITEEEIVLIAPADGINTSVNNITFWWEPLDDDSLMYHLEVVSPSFDAPELLILDTTVFTNTFSYNIGSGSYEWRVQGDNGAYETEYSTRSFSILDTVTLTGEVVNLSSPKDDLITNASVQTFAWGAVEHATVYQLLIKDGAWTSNDTILDTLITQTSITYDLPEGDLAWGIKAIQAGNNSASSTSYSIASIVVDTTAPVIAVLTLPENNDTVRAFPLNFSWQSITDEGTAFVDSVYVTTDEDFEDNFILETVASGFTTSIDTMANNTYYWSVKRIDAAGNSNGLANIRTFVVSK